MTDTNVTQIAIQSIVSTGSSECVTFLAICAFFSGFASKAGSPWADASATVAPLESITLAMKCGLRFVPSAAKVA